MKMRALTLAVALLFASAALSSSALAQNQNPTSSTPSAGQQPSTPPADSQQPPADTAAPPPTDSASPTSTAPAATTPAAQPNVKAGGKDDVDSIGNRKMGGKGLGNWYSLEKEIQMGKELSMQVDSSVKLVKDPVVNEYINRIGQNLVRNSDAKVPFTIKVIDDDSVNAFALPGGFMYVNSGAILAADEEDELAGVMAHEIAHVAARHATREMTRANWANIATIPLIFVGGGLGYAVRTAASLMLPMTFMKFSRGFESEADHLGIEYMYKAGYDPNGLVTYFEKVQAMEKKRPGALAKAFDSHPQTPDRISATQHEIATILPARDQYLVDTSEFEDVKARLAAIENKRKLNDDKDNSRPSLRRSTAQNHPDQGTTSEDDRPVLKKRDQ
ncbi:MAG TPA: M48 family metallopeptidase [Terriglobales bacterium]|jgi:predicted Zn-dependent protease|nr:M48 family metallopeptidase [Terriglobales bacterium]